MQTNTDDGLNPFQRWAKLRDTPRPPPPPPPPPPKQPTNRRHFPALSVGDVKGVLTLLEYRPGRRKPRQIGKWKCRCTCGAIVLVQANNLHTWPYATCTHKGRI